MIDNILTVPNIYKDAYKKTVDDGIEHLKSKKIVVLGLCRNLENVIEKNIQKIINFVEKYCLEYKLVIFENDSSDNTKQKLLDLSKQNNNITILSQNFNRPQFGTVKDRARTEALAEYRNILKDYVKTNFSHYDYSIVIDTDFQDFNTDGVLNSFGWLHNQNHISAICGNSFEIKPFMYPHKPSLWNYDCWAFRSSWWEDLQFNELTEVYNYNQMLWFGMWILPPGSLPIRINSGFGGLCIYKTSYFIGGQYFGYDCEHVTFHYNISTNMDGFHMYLNPSQIMLLG